MFCPVCKAEYRPGIYRCSDCNVLLVESLPDSSGEDRATPKRGGSLVLLWTGHDPVVFTAILNALGEEEIPFHEAPAFHRSAVGRAIFPTYDDASPSFRIRVFEIDFERASRVLAALLEQRGAGELKETPEWLPEAPPEGIPAFPGAREPEEMTREIWSGNENDAMAAYLMDIFRENQLPARLLRDPDGAGRILVCPADERHARAILRQVLEGEPPA